VSAQTCGKSFAKFLVVDEKDKVIPEVTIELIGELPKSEYQKFKRAKGYKEYGGFNFKLAPSEAEEMLKLIVPIRSGTDFCGNPLKQRKDVTLVKNVDVLSGRQPSAHNFGFCAADGYLGVNLAKLSAPGYQTEYYLGSYLRGCLDSYSFTLTRILNSRKTIRL
jgi:hypothetical protein